MVVVVFTVPPTTLTLLFMTSLAPEMNPLVYTSESGADGKSVNGFHGMAEDIPSDPIFNINDEPEWGIKARVEWGQKVGDFSGAPES